jgi:ferritin-like metal-binding protein YciE
MVGRPDEILKRYLQDAIAAERSFESQLRTFAREADDPQLQRLFSEHAEETRIQHEQLSRRLEEIGGSPSAAKSFLAHLFGIAPKAAPVEHEDTERTIHDLVIAFAVENSEIAMYEALAVAAMAAGDSETEQLARRIQEEERITSEKVWRMLGPAARRSFNKLTIKAA